MKLRKATLANFNNIFAIMEKSFPFDEYRTYQEQKKLLNDSRYKIYVYSSTNDENISGFITVWKFDKFAYIEHFAVSPDYRNQGIGSQMLTELSQSLACQICLEVELPKTELAIKRIEFYKRNGFYLNDYPYVQPPYSKDKQEIPLLLMTTQKAINESEFEYIKFILYNNVYKVNIK